MLDVATPEVAAVLSDLGWLELNLFCVSADPSPNLVEREGLTALPNLVDPCGEMFSPNFLVTVKAGACGFKPEPKGDLGCSELPKELFVSGRKKLSPSS